jgi:hypothetical protein
MTDKQILTAIAIAMFSAANAWASQPPSAAPATAPGTSTTIPVPGRNTLQELKMDIDFMTALYNLKDTELSLVIDVLRGILIEESELPKFAQLMKNFIKEIKQREASPEDKKSFLDALKRSKYNTAKIEAARKKAWEPDRHNELGKYVVRVNGLALCGGVAVPCIGTATIVDLGIDALRGKVVITCAHCCDVDKLINSITKTEFKKYSAAGGIFTEGDTHNARLSVTRETVDMSGALPLINTEEEHDAADRNTYKVTEFYIPSNASDIAICILDRAITDEHGAALIGIRLEKCATKMEQIDDLFFIGYGLIGIMQANLPLSSDGLLLPGAGEHIKEGKLVERQDFLKKYGWNSKKLGTMRKEGDEIVSPDVYGGGFSGSLILNQDNKCVGVYGGGIDTFNGEFFKFLNAVKKDLGGTDSTPIGSDLEKCYIYSRRK